MIVAIASGKGGTGKTTVSTNLLAYISTFQKVVLVDLDVEEPNSGLFLNATKTNEEDKFAMVPAWDENKCTNCGECQGHCNFNAIIQLGETIMIFPELCHSCFACSELCNENALPMVPQKIGTIRHYEKDNLTFIESRLKIGLEQSTSLIEQTKKYVNERFGKETLVIYDAPPGTSCPVIEATKNVDYVVLVTEPTPFGLHDLKLAVETMKLLGKDFGVIINRDGMGNKDLEEYCQKNHIPIITRIPNHRIIAKLYSEGKLIYKHSTELKRKFENIASHLISYPNLVEK